MLTNEERAVFESELIKLNSEYRKCTDRSLKMQIAGHIALVQSALAVQPNKKPELS